MKKKNLLSTLLLISTCTPLCACSGEASNVKLFYAYSTENLMADWDYFSKKDEIMLEENAPFFDRDSTLRFNCLKGENEAQQLMIHTNRYVNSFDFKCPDMVSEDGTTIASSNFDVSVAWYQNIDGSNEKNAYAGEYPDALIPLANYKWRRKDQIQKDKNQALYVNFLSTYDMKAGNYKGEGTLTLDGDEYKVPFELTIYDADMPEECNAATSFLIWYELIVNGERENDTIELEMNYYNFLLEHRITPSYLPPAYDSTPTNWAKNYYKYCYNNPKVTTYRIPMNGDTSEKHATDLLTAVIDLNIKLRKGTYVDDEGNTICDPSADLFKKLYFYVDDEPTTTRFEDVREHDKTYFDVKEKLASTLLVGYPDLQDSLCHIRNLVTVAYTDKLVATNETGGVQCWCPQFQNFNTAKQRENYKNRQASSDRRYGENVWWYGCESPTSPYPSYHLDADLITSRMIPYMQYEYGVEGTIFWNVCYYAKHSQGITMARDIWYDAISWGRCAGDGYFLYPGIDYGIKGPIATLRLKSVQASYEEYEYLNYIQNMVDNYNISHSSSYDANKLLTDKYLSKIFTNMIAETDHAKFNNVRIELLKLCEKFNKNVDEGMAYLLAD